MSHFWKKVYLISPYDNIDGRRSDIIFGDEIGPEK
jgi:hypothetical protein